VPQYFSNFLQVGFLKGKMVCKLLLLQSCTKNNTTMYPEEDHVRDGKMNITRVISMVRTVHTVSPGAAAVAVSTCRSHYVSSPYGDKCAGR